MMTTKLCTKNVTHIIITRLKALSNGKIQKSLHTILILSLLLLLFLLFNHPHFLELKKKKKKDMGKFSAPGFSVQLSLQPNTALASGRGGNSPLEDEKIEGF
jgi:hypothetical protein